MRGEAHKRPFFLTVFKTIRKGREATYHFRPLKMEDNMTTKHETATLVGELQPDGSVDIYVKHSGKRGSITLVRRKNTAVESLSVRDLAMQAVDEAYAMRRVPKEVNS